MLACLQSLYNHGYLVCKVTGWPQVQRAVAETFAAVVLANTYSRLRDSHGRDPRLASPGVSDKPDYVFQYSQASTHFHLLLGSCFGRAWTPRWKLCIHSRGKVKRNDPAPKYDSREQIWGCGIDRCLSFLRPTYFNNGCMCYGR